ncbi:hypothetical protein [Streptomyces sp. NPDC048611]|uniref:hypothetical protein n=1 Tax=Streptomyces sp. NPDC048611 TaxID=3155635 RepID=UPI003448937B
MTAANAYVAAHNRVRTLHGPARNHPCEFCGLRAHDWALDWEAPEIIRDQQWRAYSPNPDFYMPLCRSCHKAYDAHVSKYGPDAPGVLRLRDSLWRAVDPALRAAQRKGLENSFTALQMWLKNADDVIVRRVRTFYLESPDPVVVEDLTPRDWFDALFTRHGEITVAGTAAFNAYLDWAEAENLPQRERWKRTTYYAELVSRGAVRKTTKLGVAFAGIALRETTEGLS